MESRKLHVRTKVIALLASFAALWAFAAYMTLREGVSLLWVSTMDSNVGRPAEALVSALQQERRLSVVYLANRGTDPGQALATQRAQTDRAVADFRRLAGSAGTRRAASPVLEQHIDDLIGQVSGLGRARTGIDGGDVDRTAAASTFTAMINATFRVSSAEATLDDLQLARDGETLVALSRARDLLSQEDALLAGVIEAGRFTGSEHPRLLQLVGAQRLLHEDAAAQLPPADRDRYRHLVDGAAATRLRALEDLVTDRGRAGAPPPVDAKTWSSAVTPVLDELRALIRQATDGMIARTKPLVVGTVVRLVVSVLGLVAVIAAIVVSVTTARSLVRQLRTLRDAALGLADARLPWVVDRLRRGEEVDIAAEAPPVPYGAGAIGQVGSAFNAVQETAIRVAVEQAELRRGVRDVFLSLARRTQALVHRQLTTLDGMERREDDPEVLADLFRVDHLATRMRRNAENLIVLSGAVPGRGWRQPVPLVDVVRGAAAEIEDYERVTVLPMPPAALTGRVVGDVIHLLAELIENATSFSPPDTPVHVGGQAVAKGFAVEIEDRGLGLTEEELALANERLRNPPEFKLSSTARLGLYVVGQLAMRHGIRVRLKESPYGGTVAVVLIPTALVLDGTGDDTPAARRRRARSITGEAVAPAISGGTAISGGPAISGGTGNETGPAGRASAGVLVRPQPRPEPWPEPLDFRDGESPAPPTHTTTGLPRRVRQASLAEQLQHDPAEIPEPAADGPARSPDDIRRMLASFQRQTRLGRSDAERTLDARDDLDGTPPATGAAPRENPGEED